jgi:hypothetical protein
MSLEQALAANTAAIEKLVAILANPPVVDMSNFPPPPAEDPAPKTKRTKKEAAPEAPAGEPAAPEATAPSPEAGAIGAPVTEGAAAPTEPPTYADAAAAVTRVVKELGTPEGKALLRCFDAANLKQVAPERYAEVITTAEGMLKGEITL